MSKDHIEIEKKCVAVVHELTALINMKYINSLVALNKEDGERKEATAKIIRPALVGLKGSLDNVHDLFHRLLRQNKKSDAKNLLISLESNLQHFLNYYLPASILYEYIINNWNGVYKLLIFQKSSPKLKYSIDQKNFVVDKKLYTEGALTFFHDCLQLCWENAWENLREMQEEYYNSIDGKKPAGRKKKRPTMEQIYSKVWLDKDIDKLKDLEYVEFDSVSGKLKWKKSMKELAKYFWQAKRKNRFNEGFTVAECGAAFLSYFNKKEIKSTQNYFLPGYYRANFYGKNNFPI